MQQILRNKKLFITLLAGILLVTAAIGAGTYAWFTGGDKIEIAGDFNTGSIKVSANTGSMVAYNFYPGDAIAIAQQDILEKSMYDNNALKSEDDRNTALKTWVSTTQANPGWSPRMPSEQVVPGRLNFIVNPFNGANPNYIYNMSPGSMFLNKYSFNFEGTMVAYFRVKASDIIQMKNGDPIPSEMIQAIFIQSSDPTGIGNNLYALTYSDGYFYCDVPLMPGEISTINFRSLIYILGEENDAPMQTEFKFNGVFALETIQATNNAVYMADGWKDVVGVDGFDYMPYLDTAAYNTWLTQWGF